MSDAAKPDGDGVVSILEVARGSLVAIADQCYGTWVVSDRIFFVYGYEEDKGKVCARTRFTNQICYLCKDLMCVVLDPELVDCCRIV